MVRADRSKGKPQSAALRKCTEGFFLAVMNPARKGAQAMESPALIGALKLKNNYL